MKLTTKPIETKEPDTLFGDEAADILNTGEQAIAPMPIPELGNEDDTEIVERDEPSEPAEPANMESIVVADLPSDFAGEASTNVATTSPVEPPKSDTNKELESASRKQKFQEAFCEIEWKESIRDAQERYTAIAIEHRKATEHAKLLKKQMETALEAVENIIARGPKKPLPLFDRPATTEPVANQSVVIVTTSEAATASESSGNESDEWKSRSINELELGKSLTEKLIENGIDTIGRLENLRAEIATGREKWPKGIGEAKITKIEDAVIDWLTKNRDSGIFGQQTEAEETEESESTESVENENPKAKALGEPISVNITKEIRYQGGKLEVGDLYDVELSSEGNLSAVLPDGKGLVELDDNSYTVFKRKPIAEVEPVAEPEPVGTDFLADL